MTESFADMVFHSLDGDAHPGGYLLVAASVKGFEHDDLFADGRKGFNGRADLAGNFEMTDSGRLNHFFSKGLTMLEDKPFPGSLFFDMVDQQVAGDDKHLLFHGMLFR